jgi:hypothetical protein
VLTGQLPRLGDFEGRPLADAFAPAPGDVRYGTRYYGLVESDFWPYGAVRTESGRWYAYHRGINGRASTGAGIMSQGDGPLRFDPRSLDCYRGAVARGVEDGAELYRSVDVPGAFSLRVGTERVEWSETTHLRLAGPIAGPGLQMLTAWREDDGSIAHHLHAHLGYEVHGEVFGEPVSGYLGLARTFLPYGLEWLVDGQRFGPARGLCSLWIAFLNAFDYGSTERGMMAHGGRSNGFRFASVVRRDGLEFSTDLVEVDYRVSPHPHLEAVDLRVGNGQEWRFRAEPGDRLDLTAAHDGAGDGAGSPAGYRVSLGTMRRAGDERVPTVQVAWAEGFPEAWAADAALAAGDRA